MMKKAKTRSWKKALIVFLVPAFGMFFHAFSETRYVVEYTTTNIEQDNKTTVANNGDDTTNVSPMTIVGVYDTGKIDLRVVSDKDGKNTELDTKNMLRVVDGKIVSLEEMKAILPSHIANVVVLKDGAATALYGEEGKNGVIDITTTKEPVEKPAVEVINDANQPLVDVGAVMRSWEKGEKNPLVMVDGKEYAMDFNSLDPNTIKNITVMKDASATALYGEKAKNGIVIIDTKTAEKSYNKLTPEIPAGSITSFDQMKADQPVIVVDGEPYSKGIETIPTEIIESITVLKDVEAVKDGEKAKNDIIVVTTKKKSDKIKAAQKKKDESRLIMQEKQKEMLAKQEEIEAKMQVIMQNKEKEVDAMMQEKQKEIDVILKKNVKDEKTALLIQKELQEKQKEIQKTVAEAEKEMQTVIAKAQKEIEEFEKKSNEAF